MALALLKRFPAVTAAVGYSLLYTAFFAPVLFAGRVLANGDGFLFGLPAFLAGRELWTDMLFAGYPTAADPQMMAWYPVAAIFALAGLDGFNLFVLSGYVLASTFAFGYARALTGSTLGGAVAGLVYGLGGFMISHLGHTNMVHTAAWLPLALHGVEALRRGWNRRWFAATAVAIGMCLVAGHPQIFVYASVVLGVYVAVCAFGATQGAVRYAATTAASVALGVGLGAVLLVPMLELARAGLRSEMSFEAFTSFSLPPAQTICVLFPYLFGGAAIGPYETAYAGEWYLGEVTGYVGLVTLVLAGIGLMAARRDRVVWIWVAAAALALTVAVGGATPLGRVLYHVPVVNMLRAPARTLVVLTLSASVLAAYGVSAVEAARVRFRGVAIAVSVGAAGMVAAVAGIFRYADALQSAVVRTGDSWASSLSLRSPAVAVPLAVFVAGAAALLVWAWRPQGLARRALIVAVLVADLASFGWFFAWRQVPSRADCAPPDRARRYGPALVETRQRLLPVRDNLGAPVEVAPNISRLWGVPSAGGYSPLVLRRYSELARMEASGAVSGNWSAPDDVTLDLLATRYVVLPGVDRAALDPASDLAISLGTGCDAKLPLDASLALAAPARAAALSVVSTLACSTSVPDDAEVARLTVVDVRGESQQVSLLAGRDTSEWAIDCGDVRAVARHRRAEINESFSTTRASGEQCLGHRYRATLALPHPADVARIEVAWTAPYGTLILRSIMMTDESGTTRKVTMLPGGLADGSRWRQVEDSPSGRVYENLRARPRAWLAFDTERVDDAASLAAIRTSRLPDGRPFDPARTALVETAGAETSADSDPSSSAEVVFSEGSSMEVRTRSASPALLVTSDAWYPGWTATVDGAPADVVRADYALRGVKVPAGEHTVTFVYRPRSVYLGATVSLVAGLTLLAVSYGGRLRARRRTSV